MKSWSKRWWVLWPKVAHPVFGRLLGYFVDQDSATAQGIIHVPGLLMRMPKTLRPRCYCVRLQCNQVVAGGSQLLTIDKKFIIGSEDEDTLRGWTKTLLEVAHSAAALGAAPLAPANCDGWLLKKNPRGIAWWKMRWFELRGTTLQYWDSENKLPAGDFDLRQYQLYFPPPNAIHREREIILVPNQIVEVQHSASSGACANLVPRSLCADDDEQFERWKAALIEITYVQEEQFVPQLAMTVSDEGEVMIETLAIADADTGSEIKDEKVSLEDFDMLSVIGKGGFGKVLLVRKKDTREKFAMKVLLKDFIIKRKEVQHTKVEREILATVSHPFLVSLHHAFHTQSKLYLIVDFVSGGELYFHLRKKKQFPEDQAKFFMAELAMALAHLHSLDICYRDLKPENVRYRHCP